MRIYRRTDFLELPAGTVFISGIGSDFHGPLSIKGQTLGNDFVRLDLDSIESSGSDQLFDRLQEMEVQGASYPLNEDYGRDGRFEPDAVFLVFERGDIQTLIGILEASLQVAAAGPHESADK